MVQLTSARLVMPPRTISEAGLFDGYPSEEVDLRRMSGQGYR
jgi:hypothetical protein